MKDFQPLCQLEQKKKKSQKPYAEIFSHRVLPILTCAFQYNTWQFKARTHAGDGSNNHIPIAVAVILDPGNVIHSENSLQQPTQYPTAGEYAAIPISI